MIRRCPSFEGYSVSEYGEVYSHRKRKKSVGKYGSDIYIDYEYMKKLKPYKDSKGYLVVSNSSGLKYRPLGVAVLVADAFIRPNDSGEVVRHLDDNKDNNHFKNLAYGTINDNNQDRKINGGYTHGEKHHNAKLKHADALKIRELRKTGVSVKQLSSGFNVSISTIESIIYNKSYTNDN